MTKKEKVLWLDAIAKLREHYKKYPLDEVPADYGTVMKISCPLCRIAFNLPLGCGDCLWEKYEGKNCRSGSIGFHSRQTQAIDSPYYLDTTQQRLDRLDRWEKRIEEEELK